MYAKTKTVLRYSLPHGRQFLDRITPQQNLLIVSHCEITGNKPVNPVVRMNNFIAGGCDKHQREH
jgi:hypothetical protein